jgi:hypothetical protein
VRGAEAASPQVAARHPRPAAGQKMRHSPPGSDHCVKRVFTANSTKAISRGLPDTCPAGGCLSIENRRLWIRKPSSGGRERKPIDIFFSALATDCGEHAAAVRR